MCNGDIWKTVNGSGLTQSIVVASFARVICDGLLLGQDWQFFGLDRALDLKVAKNKINNETVQIHNSIDLIG